jgi:ABC-type phosphate transport system substrate-binding protein
MSMNCARVIALLFAACACAGAQCPPGTLAVIVNRSNPTQSLSVAQLRRLLIGDVRVWPDHKAVTLVERDPASRVFQCSLANIVRLSPSEYHRYIMGAQFRGEEAMAVQTSDSDASSARMVASSDGSLAIVNLSSVAAFARWVKVIRVNSKNPGEPGYPL